MSSPSLDPAYFERLYAARPDPWDFERSAYEHGKYAATVAALDRPRYARGLEIGCSVGVLTRILADRCDALTAIDVNERALEAARRRCADRRGVVVERYVLPQEFPSGRFDLIVLSEVGYYFSSADLARVRDLIADALDPNGSIMLVHYLPVVPEYPGTGDGVHAAFLADPRFTPVTASRADRYRLDLLRCA